MTTPNSNVSCYLPSRMDAAAADVSGNFEISTKLIETKMIGLTGSEFRMGADDSPYPQDGEGPARDILIDPFELAATAVTAPPFVQ